MFQRFLGFSALLLITVYFILYYQLSAPFTLAGGISLDSSSAKDRLNTKQILEFSLANISKYPLKLVDIEMGDQIGVKIGDIFVENGQKFEPRNGLVIPSHRVYFKDGWGTNNQRVSFKYEATILGPEIQLPQEVQLTYQYFGIKRKQVIELPK